MNSKIYIDRRNGHLIGVVDRFKNDQENFLIDFDKVLEKFKDLAMYSSLAFFKEIILHLYEALTWDEAILEHAVNKSLFTELGELNYILDAVRESLLGYNKETIDKYFLKLSS